MFTTNKDDQQRKLHSKVRSAAAGLSQLVLELGLPYRKFFLIILVAMVFETVISLATPWPLKIIIDNVIGGKPLPHELTWIQALYPEGLPMALAALCAATLVLLTALGGLAGYINNYYTESVAQYMASDLRRRTYHHLQHLSLAYYDKQQVGKLLGTITTDVTSVQDFISSTILNMLVDSLTILGMFGLMLYLRWDFALISVAVAPFLLVFIIRFRKEVKKATHEVRKDQAEMLTVIQQGLESIRAVNAFGRQDLEEDRLQKLSMDTVDAALRARRIKSFISPVFLWLSPSVLRLYFGVVRYSFAPT